MNEIQRLALAMKNAKRILFFGGAGVSTESGIPDFRSEDGLYRQKYDYPPETILSHTFYQLHTEEFYRFYYDKMLFPFAKPNGAHKVLADLEKEGKMEAVVTQNIDGLHQLAGSKKVFELHGSVHRNHCVRCGAFFSLKDLLKQAPNVPRCPCGGTVKPDVVLYEEPLDYQTQMQSLTAIQSADLLIVGGTSLNVYPAAGMVDYFQGDTVALINLSATPFDDKADVVIRKPIGKTLQEAYDLMKTL